MTLKELLGYLTVKETAILSILGYLGYKVYSNDQTIHLVAKRVLENEAKTSDESSYSSVRSETETGRDSADHFAFGFRANK